MSVLLASALFVAALAHQPGHDPAADFSGTWRMDPERSVTAKQVHPVGPVTIEVTQAPDRITVRTTASGRTRTDVYRFDSAATPSAPGEAVARWKDGALELDAVRTISGQSVTHTQSWRLAENGSELHVESVLNVQHGYSAVGSQVYATGLDVYVRAAPGGQ